MSLAAKIKKIYPSLTREDFDVTHTGTIMVQNDSDGKGDYIKSWSYDIAEPTDDQLNSYNSTATTEENNQFCDFTGFILNHVKESVVVNGSLNLYTPHTTTCFIVNESETGYINDFRSFIEDLVPSEKYYEHDDWEKRTENMQEDEFKNGNQ